MGIQMIHDGWLVLKLGSNTTWVIRDHELTHSRESNANELV